MVRADGCRRGGFRGRRRHALGGARPGGRVAATGAGTAVGVGERARLLGRLFKASISQASTTGFGRRERRSSTRSPTGRGVKRVHGGGSGRNLVELLRGGRLRLEGRQLLTTTASDAVGAPVAVAGQIPVEAGVSLASRHWCRAGASSTNARAGCDAEVAVYDRCCVAYVAAGDLRADRAAGRWQSDPGDVRGMK